MLFWLTAAFKQQWFGFIQVLMKILSTRGALERGVCLDALVSIMLDSSSNQMVWSCRPFDLLEKRETYIPLLTYFK